MDVSPNPSDKQDFSNWLDALITAIEETREGHELEWTEPLERGAGAWALQLGYLNPPMLRVVSDDGTRMTMYLYHPHLQHDTGFVRAFEARAAKRTSFEDDAPRDLGYDFDFELTREDRHDLLAVLRQWRREVDGCAPAVPPNAAPPRSAPAQDAGHCPSSTGAPKPPDEPLQQDRPDAAVQDDANLVASAAAPMIDITQYELSGVAPKKTLRPLLGLSDDRFEAEIGNSIVRVSRQSFRAVLNKLDVATRRRLADAGLAHHSSMQVAA